MQIVAAPVAGIAYFLTLPLALLCLVSGVRPAGLVMPGIDIMFVPMFAGIPFYFGVAAISRRADRFNGHRNLAVLYLTLALAMSIVIVMCTPVTPNGDALILAELLSFAPSILFAAAAHEETFVIAREGESESGPRDATHAPKIRRFFSGH